MDGHPTSSSMPDIYPPLDWQRALQASQRALHSYATESPSLQQFRNNTAGIWAPDHQHLASPAFEAARNVQSPSSDTTVKQHEGSVYPRSEDSYAFKSVAMVYLMKTVGAGLGKEPRAFGEYFADARGAERFVGENSRRETYSLPSPWNATAPRQENERDYTHDTDGYGSNGYQLPRQMLRSVSLVEPVGSPKETDLWHRRMGSPQELHVPEQTTLHHRRMSSRISSLPKIPSPLGPGRMGVLMEGLVLPVPASLGLKLEYTDQMSPVSASPTVQGYMTGLHQRHGEASPSAKPPSFGNGAGHSRKDTDPFIDYADSSPPKPFTLPSRVPKTPTPNFPSFTASRAARPILSIPPPPLSSVRGQYTHTPSARAALDAQKPARGAWIRDTAAEIAKCSGLRYAAEQQYLSTQSPSDFEIWQEAEVAYAAATDLEARKEERRNRFLGEKGMVALKTGVVGDASASASAGGGEGEERLLGFRMAYMERVCAEVRREEESEEGITREMLATLTMGERKALRAHLVGRLVKG